MLSLVVQVQAFKPYLYSFYLVSQRGERGRGGSGVENALNLARIKKTKVDGLLFLPKWAWCKSVIFIKSVLGVSLARKLDLQLLLQNLRADSACHTVTKLDGMPYSPN